MMSTQGTVQSTALAVQGRVRRQHQDGLQNNDATTCKLLAQKNRLHKAYVTRPIDDNKAAFYRGCRLVRQRLREMQDAWTACKADEIQGIVVRVLLNRLNHHMEQSLQPKSQYGFRRHRGTTYMIFAARQLQEKCQEMRTHLYPNFVDLTKSFDTVNRGGLWKVK
nr:unnamed protein product [Spirometra erinaceieuropaei]